MNTKSVQETVETTVPGNNTFYWGINEGSYYTELYNKKSENKNKK